jgi:hypothetical protein
MRAACSESCTGRPDRLTGQSPCSFDGLAIPALTLDTSVVIAAADETSSAAELIRRAQAGDFDLALSTRADFQLKKSLADGELAAYIAGLQRLLPPGRWADPTSEDLPTDTWGNFKWADTPGRTGVSVGSKLDDDHLESHRMAGRDHFVTLDDGQLKRGNRLGLSAMTPAQILARYPSQPRY